MNYKIVILINIVIMLGLWVYFPMLSLILPIALSISIIISYSFLDLARPYAAYCTMFIVNLVAMPIIGTLFILDQKELKKILEVNFG